jgi:mono/diheme cytochrome c family protein
MWSAIVLAASLGFGVADALAQPDTELLNKGRAIIEANCARCHAIGAEGASPHPQAPPFRVVVTRYPLGNLAEALAEGILTGHPDMPEFVFQPPEIEAILFYLDSLKSSSERK